MPGADQHPLELRRLPHELQVLRRGAVAHHPLDAGPVVPGPVEEHDLAGRRQVLDVALEVPLGLLALARLLQRHDLGAARVEVLHEALDRAALAGRVPALEEDDHLLAARLHPVLQLEQLDLQQPLGALVLVPAQPLVVRVALPPGVHHRPVRADQHRVVLVVGVHPQLAEVVDQRAVRHLRPHLVGNHVDGPRQLVDGLLGHRAPPGLRGGVLASSYPAPADTAHWAGRGTGAGVCRWVG